jgi:hypothetical protein
MMPGLPVVSIPQSELTHHDGACLELLQAIGRLMPSFIEAHHAWKMISNVSSFNSRIKIRSFLEEIITSTQEVFKD